MLRPYTLSFVLCHFFLLFNPELLDAGEVPFSDRQVIDDAFQGGVLLGDLDGDGDDDAVTLEPSGLSWWQNNDLVWTESSIVATNPTSAAVGDLDRDGDLDVVATLGSPIGAAPVDLVWFENNGDGSSFIRHDVGLANWAQPADIDGDGDLDLFGGSRNPEELSWWENTSGNGNTWTKHSIESGGSAASVAVAADLDGDGDTDLLGPSMGQDTLSWWKNGGTGASWTRHGLENALEEVGSAEIADMDGDGDLDVLAGTRRLTPSNELRFGWWENVNGDASTWIEHNLSTSSIIASRVYPVDLDRDTDMDFLGVEAFGGIFWWENTAGDASTWIEHQLEGDINAFFRIPVGDLDQDGDPDLIGMGLSTGLVWWRNETLHRNSAFPTPLTISDSVPGAGSLATADLDGDSDPDVLVSSSTGVLSWWQNALGDGTSWVEHEVATELFNASGLSSADLDGDSDADILAASGAEGGVFWWENTAGDGTAWTQRSLDPTFQDLADLQIADIDRDGDLDVIAASATAGLVWWENAEPVPLSNGRLPTDPSRPKVGGDGSNWTLRTVEGSIEAWSVDVADIDGDGDLDLLSTDFLFDTVLWFENTAGDGSAWTNRDVTTDLDGPTRARIADFNRDGKPDVVATSFFDDGTTLFINDGSGGWSPRVIDGIQMSALGTSNLDLDGDVDLVGSRGPMSNASRLTNEQEGLAWTVRAAQDSSDVQSLSVADLDGDGTPDLIATKPSSNGIVWWPNRGGQVALLTYDATTTQTVAPGLEAFLLLDVRALHHGREGDGDFEPAGLTLLFEEAEGDPLSSGELNDLVDRIRVFRDDGDLLFDPDLDSELLAETGPFTLEGGVLDLAVPDGAPAAQVPWQEQDDLFVEPAFFITVDMASAIPTGADSLRVTHLTAPDNSMRSRVEMSSTDLPLDLEAVQDVASCKVTLADAPFLVATPVAPDFGDWPIDGGATTPIDLLLTNQGTADLVISSVLSDGTATFSIIADTAEGLLAPGESRTLSVVFDPTSIGFDTADIGIVSNHPTPDPFLVTLRGRGIDREMTVEPSAIGFGLTLVGGSSSQRTVTITNTGTSPLAVTDVSLSDVAPLKNGGADFSIVGDTGQSFLDAGESRWVTLVFRPTDTGAQQARLSIASDDPDAGIVDVSLTGVGVGAEGIFFDAFESGDLSAWASSVP